MKTINIQSLLVWLRLVLIFQLFHYFFNNVIKWQYFLLLSILGVMNLFIYKKQMGNNGDKIYFIFNILAILLPLIMVFLIIALHRMAADLLAI